MTMKMIALVALGALAATDAVAQSVGTQSWVPNLSGVYRCVHNCEGAGLVHVVQSGRGLDITNEIGQASTAWIDWPGHIWTQAWNEGAVYSADGFTIQFNRGTVWVLVVPTPVPGRNY
jgi:Flp pilus assembly protein CpaB